MDEPAPLASVGRQHRQRSIETQSLQFLGTLYGNGTSACPPLLVGSGQYIAHVNDEGLVQFFPTFNLVPTNNVNNGNAGNEENDNRCIDVKDGGTQDNTKDSDDVNKEEDGSAIAVVSKDVEDSHANEIVTEGSIDDTAPTGHGQGQELDDTVLDAEWAVETMAAQHQQQHYAGRSSSQHAQTNDSAVVGWAHDEDIDGRGHLVVVTASGVVSLVAYDAVAMQEQRHYQHRPLEQTSAVRLIRTFATSSASSTPSCVGWSEAYHVVTVGYRTGQIEEWSAHGSLRWKTAPHNELEVTDLQPISQDVNQDNDQNSGFIAVCLLQRLTPVLPDRPQHNVTVEVLDRHKLKTAFDGTPLALIDHVLWPQDSSNSNGGLRSTDPVLIDPSVLPDVASRTTSRRSFGSNRLCRFRSRLNPCQDTPSFVGAVLDDGTVGVATFSMPTGDGVDDNDSDKDVDDGNNNNDHSTMKWGVSDDNHMALLSFPAIGAGFLRFQRKLHLVCCLRGGTVYLLPIHPQHNKENKETGNDTVTVFRRPLQDPDTADDHHVLHPHQQTQYHPHDSQQFDGSLYYLQSFACGNIHKRNDTTTNNNNNNNNGNDGIPIVVYVGPAGIMDVYACGLYHHHNDRLATKLLLEQLLENGVLRTVLEMLQSPFHDNIGLQQNEDNPDLAALWKNAMKECRSNPPRNGTDFIQEHKQYPATVCLFQHMANTDHGG